MTPPPDPSHDLTASDHLVSGDAPEMLAFLIWLGELGQKALDRDSDVRDDTLAASLPQMLGRFRLDSLLGAGAFAAVFRAWDQELERPVALKVAWPAVLMHPEASRRFIDEAKVVANLKHPGIVEVYDSGSYEMARYISLELIEGPTLAEWLRREDQVPLRVAAATIQRIAEAVGHAHRQGIVHRDLKPSNVLLRPKREGATKEADDWDPVVTDFGLARRAKLTDLSDKTASFAIVGTDRYMSPEQAAGHSSDVGPQSDVFSLGVMFYELVAGRRPFDGESAEQVRQLILDEDPPSIRPWRKNLPRDLETIIWRCLEKSPSQRYPDADSLAKDLERFLTHQPIHARRTPPWQRGLKLLRRHPWGVALSVLGLLVALAFAGLAGAMIEQRSSAARQLATAEAAARSAEGMERQYAYASTIRYAAIAQSRGNRTDAEMSLREAEKLAFDPVRKGVEWFLLEQMAGEVDRVLPAHIGGVKTLRFSPDNKTLYSGGGDNRLIFWDVPTWTQKRAFINKGGAPKIAEPSPDGKLLAVGGDNGRVLVYRTDDASIVFNEKLSNKRYADIAWLGDSQRFAIGGDNGILSIIDPLKPEIRQSASLEPSPESKAIDPIHPNEISHIAYIPSRKLLLVTKEPPDSILVDPVTLRTVGNLGQKIRAAGPGAICHISKHEPLVAIAGAAVLHVVRAKDWSIHSTIPIRHGLDELRYSTTLGKLFAATRDGSIQSWDMESRAGRTGPANYSFAGHRGRCLAIDISPDGAWLASGGRDFSIRVWKSPTMGTSLEQHLVNRPEIIGFSPCGRWLAISEIGSTGVSHLSLYELTTGKRIWSASIIDSDDDKALNYGYQDIWNFAFDSQGNEILHYDAKRGIIGRETATGALTDVYLSAEEPIRSFRFSPKGDEIVIGNGIGTSLIRRSDRTTSFDFSKGPQLAGSFLTTDGEVWIDADSARVTHLRRRPGTTPFLSLLQTPNRIDHSAMSKDGHYLATISQGPVIYLWDLQRPKSPYRLQGHEGRVVLVAFSQDGNTLLSLSSDGIVCLWHVPTKSELMKLGSAEEKILCMALHPEDRMLALGIQRKDQFGLKIFRLGPDGAKLPSQFEVDSPATDDE